MLTYYQSLYSAASLLHHQVCTLGCLQWSKQTTPMYTLSIVQHFLINWRTYSLSWARSLVLPTSFASLESSSLGLLEGNEEVLLLSLHSVKVEDLLTDFPSVRRGDNSCTEVESVYSISKYYLQKFKHPHNFKIRPKKYKHNYHH